jgi:outer membrane protein assembly factor BamD (BamD/ComL family)
MALIGVFPFSALAQQSVPATPAVPVAESSAEFAQARKLLQQGKVDEAITQLRAMESRDPSTKGLDLELGTAYYKKSDYPNAIQYLKKANEGDPENVVFRGRPSGGCDSSVGAGARLGCARE